MVVDSLGLSQSLWKLPSREAHRTRPAKRGTRLPFRYMASRTACIALARALYIGPPPPRCRWAAFCHSERYEQSPPEPRATRPAPRLIPETQEQAHAKSKRAEALPLLLSVLSIVAYLSSNLQKQQHLTSSRTGTWPSPQAVRTSFALSYGGPGSGTPNA